MVIWRSEVNLCQVPSILSFLPPSSSPPSLPLSSPVSLPTLFAITLFLNPYIFQAYREDTSLFVVITFHESFTLMVAVSLDCECVADICSGIRAFRTAGKPWSPCCALPLLSATAAGHIMLSTGRWELISTCRLFSISHFTSGGNHTNVLGCHGGEGDGTLNLMKHKATITN